MFVIQGITGILTAFSIVAIVENLFMMPIILFKSGKDIGSYKMLLFFYCMIAVFYLSIATLVVPVLEPGEKGWLFYATETRVSQVFGSRAIATFANCYIMLMLILEFSFVYRYFVMCKREQLKWFNKFPHILLTIAIYATILCICAVPIYTYMCQNPELAEIFDKDKVAEPVLDLYSISYVGSPMFREDGSLDPGTSGILIIWTCAMSQFTVVCIFCIKNIMKCFKTVQLSAASRKMQKRLFFLLLAQTIVPCIFTFSPPLLSYIVAIARMHVPQISQTFTAFLPISHVVDPIMILFVVSDYRRYVFRLVSRCFGRRNAIRDNSSLARSSDAHMTSQAM